jgi:hypothetical protein
MRLSIVPCIALLCAPMSSGCASRTSATASQSTLLAQSLAVDCRPGDSSVACCIKKYPATASASCGATADEVAGVLNGMRVLNEAATSTEDAGTDDFANNAELPEWKQRCIRNYVSCKDEGWMGPCIDCLRYCEGQQEWPLDKCYERKSRVRQ